MREEPPAASVDVRKLLCFVVAARADTTRDAAAELHVGPSWLIAQIRSLERTLGAPLDRRERGGVVPTTAGRALLARTDRALNDQERLTAAIAALQREARSQINIAATRTSAIVPERVQLIERLLTAQPGVQCTVREGNSAAMLEALVRGDDDLALAIVAPDRRHRGVRLRVLVVRRSNAMLVGRTGHRLEPRPGPLAPAELADEEIVAFPRDSDPELFERAYGPLAAAGALIHETPENHPRMLLHQTAEREALTVLPDWMVPELLAEHEDLWTRPLSGLPTEDLCLARREPPDSRLTDAAWTIAEEMFPEPK